MECNNLVQPMNENFYSIKLTPDAVDSMCCPVLLEPYKNAQIVNCSGDHSVDLEAITKIFGKMQDNQCEKPGPCPVCRGKVTIYRPNRVLQSLVNSILGVDKGELHINKMYEVIRKLKMEFDNGIKYPLENGTFVLRNSNRYGAEYIDLYLDNSFGDKTPSGHIKIISCMIEVDDKKTYFTLKMFLTDEKTKHDLHDYLKKKGLPFNVDIGAMNSFQIVDMWRSTDGKGFLAAFHLLMSANTFNIKAQNAIKNLIDFAEDAIKNNPISNDKKNS